MTNHLHVDNSKVWTEGNRVSAVIKGYPPYPRPRKRAHRGFRGQVYTLDDRLLMSGPGAAVPVYGAPEVPRAHHLIPPRDTKATIDAAAFVRHGPNLSQFNAMAKYIFFHGYQGIISPSVEPQVIQFIKQGLARYDVAVVPTNPNQILVFRAAGYNFDNGGFAQTRMLVIHPHNRRKMREFALQVYESPPPQVTAEVYFAPTDPNILMVGPPATPLTAARLGSAIVKALNLQGQGVTLGPVDPEIVGAALLQALGPLNVPQSPFSLQVDPQLSQIGNGGHSLGLLGFVSFNEVFFQYQFSLEINDNNTVSALAQDLVELPYPTMNSPQFFPFTGLPQIFYGPVA